MQKLGIKQKEFVCSYISGKGALEAYRAAYGEGKEVSDSACCDGALRLLQKEEIQTYAGELVRLLYPQTTEETLRRVLTDLMRQQDATISERLKAAEALNRLVGEKEKPTQNGPISIRLEGMEEFLK